MENLDLNRFKHRFTPQKELEKCEDFTFSNWKKIVIKRSPTSVEMKKKPKIQEFFHKEQKKMIKIHKSFDQRKVTAKATVDEMNSYLKRLISEHAVLKKRVFQQDEFIQKAKKSERIVDDMNSTPYFTSIQRKVKFPRDVFSSRSKRFRY